MRLFLVLFLVLCAASAQARALSREDAAHGRDALAFAARERWDDAFIHAKRARHPMVEKIVTWMYVQKKDSGASFEEISGFLSRHPNWPQRERIRNRAEEAMNDEGNLAKAAAWLQLHAPQTPYGKRVLAEILLQSGEGASRERGLALLRQAWAGGNFTRDQESGILDRYGAYLTQQDHIARAGQLIWDGNHEAAKRLYSRLPQDYVRLFNARIALREDSHGVSGLIDAVPQRLQRDPGLLFDRIVWRGKRDQEDGVRELLLIAGDKLPNPERWWRYRESAIRGLLREKQYRKAYDLARAHGIADDKSFADAEFMAGWIAFSFLKSYVPAGTHFKRLYDQSKFPISQSRGAYWAGRAARANGNAETAAAWFTLAARHPTTFHGQLAMLELPGPRRISLPPAPAIAPEQEARFKRGELAQAVAVLDDLGSEDLLRQFLMQLVDNADSLAEAEMAARLGREIGRDYGVKAAKRALRKGYILAHSYPLLPMPADAALDRALAHAVMRQESEFKADARSPAGAVGLMQLLPSTAQHVAKRAGMPYRPGHLTEPAQNIRLGTRYLAQMIQQFGGSKVMAIAAYNAGPGRVRQWENAFGAPGEELSPLDWIETIPFSETRNYVHRVLENLQVYRALTLGEKASLDMMRDDVGLK